MIVTHKSEDKRNKEFVGVVLELETLDELYHLRRAMGQYTGGLEVYGKIREAYEKYK